jgi:hypothetical protein
MFCPVARTGLITGLNTEPPSATGPLFIGGKGLVEMSAYQRYEQAKRAWVHQHPDATSEQLEQAFKVIAERLGV